MTAAAATAGIGLLGAAAAALALVVAAVACLFGFLILDFLFFAITPNFVFKLFKSKKLQSVEVSDDSGKRAKGHGPARRNALSPDKLIDTNSEGVKTLWDNWRKLGCVTSRDQHCLGKRSLQKAENGDKGDKAGPFEWQTYKEVHELALQFGSGLEHLKLAPEGEEVDGRKLRTLAMFLKNCPEWIIAELGLYSICGTTVPIYETLGEENVAHVLNETQTKAVLCRAAEAGKIAAQSSNLPHTKAVILVGECDEATRSAWKKGNLEVHTLEDVLKAGKEHPGAQDKREPTADDIATFCYTSGTTGAPKGALLTHRNIVSTIVGVDMVLKVEASDVHLSYLPLAHVFERCVIHAVLAKGASIGFSQGDPKRIPSDLKELSPTVFPSVPRLLNRMHDTVLSGASKSFVKGALLKAGLAHKGLRLRKAGIQTHWFWDRLLFSKLKAMMGLRRCKLVLSGSAPLSPDVLQFLRCVLAPAKVVEGYGQTENCAGATVQVSMTLGDVGPPLASNEIKLVSVDDMGYKCDDTKHEVNGKTIKCLGRGEIWIRGYNVFPGYFKLPDKTAETLTEDKWIQTGDIGLWLTTGALKIIDRKKNMFKLSQGEYVAAEKIEEVYCKAELVQQAFVYGDSYQHNLVAIIVPEPEAVKSWAKANKVQLDAKAGEAVSKNKELNAAVLSQIKDAAKAAKLHGFEVAKAIYLSPEPFSEDNDLLTPTFKLKRPVAKKHFADQIDDMYSHIEGSLKHSVKDD